MTEEKTHATIHAILFLLGEDRNPWPGNVRACNFEVCCYDFPDGQAAILANGGKLEKDLPTCQTCLMFLDIGIEKFLERKQKKAEEEMNKEYENAKKSSGKLSNQASNDKPEQD